MTKFTDIQIKLQNNLPFIDTYGIELEPKILNEIDATQVEQAKKDTLKKYAYQPWYWIIRAQVANPPTAIFKKIEDRYIRGDEKLLGDTEKNDINNFYNNLHTAIEEYVTSEIDFINELRTEQTANIKQYVEGVLNETGIVSITDTIKQAIKTKLNFLNNSFSEETKEKLAQIYLAKLITPELNTAQQELAKANAKTVLEKVYAVMAEENYDRALSDQRRILLKQLNSKNHSFIVGSRDKLFHRIYQAELMKLDSNFQAHQENILTDDTIKAALVEIDKQIDAYLQVYKSENKEAEKLLAQPLYYTDENQKVKKFAARKTNPSIDIANSIYQNALFSQYIQDKFHYYFEIERRVKEKEFAPSFLDEGTQASKKISDMAGARKDQMYAIYGYEYETLTGRTYPVGHTSVYSVARLLNADDRETWANNLAKGIEKYKEQRNYLYINVVYPILESTNDSTAALNQLKAKLNTLGVTDVALQEYLAKQFIQKYKKPTDQNVVNQASLSKVKKLTAQGYEALAVENTLAKAQEHIKAIILKNLNYDETKGAYGEILESELPRVQKEIEEILLAAGIRDNLNDLIEKYLKKYSIADNDLKDDALDLSQIADTKTYDRQSAEITQQGRHKTWRFYLPFSLSMSFPFVHFKKPIQKGETQAEKQKRVQRNARAAAIRYNAAEFVRKLDEIIKRINNADVTSDNLTFENLINNEAQSLGFENQTDFNQNYQRKLKRAQEINTAAYNANHLHHVNKRDQAHLNNINNDRKNFFTEYGNQAGTTAGRGTALSTLFIITGGLLGMGTLTIPFVGLLVSFGILWLGIEPLVNKYWPDIEKMFFRIKDSSGADTDEIDLIKSEKYKQAAKSILMLIAAGLATLFFQYALPAIAKLIFVAGIGASLTFAWYIPLLAFGIFVASKFMNINFFKKMTSALISKFATLDGNFKLKWYLGYVKKFDLTPNEKRVLQATIIGNILMGVLYASLTYLKISSFISENIRDFVKKELGDNVYDSLCWFVDNVPVLGPIVALIPELIAFTFGVCIFLGYALLTTEGMARLIKTLNKYVGTPLVAVLKSIKNGFVNSWGMLKGFGGFVKVVVWDQDFREAGVQMTRAYQNYIVSPFTQYISRPLGNFINYLDTLTFETVLNACINAAMSLANGSYNIYSDATEYTPVRDTWTGWTSLGTVLSPVLLIPAVLSYLVISAKRYIFGQTIDVDINTRAAFFNFISDYALRKPLHLLSVPFQLILNALPYSKSIRKTLWSLLNNAQKTWNNVTEYTPEPHNWNLWTWTGLFLSPFLFIPSLISYAAVTLKRWFFAESPDSYDFSWTSAFNFISDYAIKKPWSFISASLQIILRPIIPFALPVAGAAGATALLTVSADSFSTMLQGSPEEGEEPTGLDENLADDIVQPILISSILVKVPLVLTGAFDVVEHLNKDQKEKIKSKYEEVFSAKEQELKALFGDKQNDLVAFIKEYKKLSANPNYAKKFDEFETLLKLAANAALQSELAIYDTDNPEAYMDYQNFRDYLFGGGAFAQSLSLAMLSKLGFEGAEALMMVNKIAQAYKKQHMLLLNEYTENNIDEATNVQRRKEVAKLMVQTTVNGHEVVGYQRIPEDILTTIKSEKDIKSQRKLLIAKVRDAEDELDNYIKEKESSLRMLVDSEFKERTEALRLSFNETHPSTAAAAKTDNAALIKKHQGVKATLLTLYSTRPQTRSEELFDRYNTAINDKATKWTMRSI